jgi:hypothetical protein
VATLWVITLKLDILLNMHYIALNATSESL